jgi:hypothetical protein
MYGAGIFRFSILLFGSGIASGIGFSLVTPGQALEWSQALAYGNHGTVRSKVDVER